MIRDGICCSRTNWSVGVLRLERHESGEAEPCFIEP